MSPQTLSGAKTSPTWCISSLFSASAKMKSSTSGYRPFHRVSYLQDAIRRNRSPARVGCSGEGLHRMDTLSERCRVILRCAGGLASKDVAAELGLHEHTVGKWRRRFLKDRCEGPGRPRSIDDDQVAAVIERTLRTTPVDATHWSIRSMGAGTGFSHRDPSDVGCVRLAATP